MPILGRLACPWCAFAGAHVKRTEGKRAYHHCPECGFMTHAKNGAQERLLLDRMRPEDGADGHPEGEHPAPAAAPAPTPPAIPRGTPTPPPPAKRAGFWDQLARRAP